VSQSGHNGLVKNILKKILKNHNHSLLWKTIEKQKQMIFENKFGTRSHLHVRKVLAFCDVRPKTNHLINHAK